MEKIVLAYLCGSNSWGGLEMNQLRNAEKMKERGFSVVILAQKDAKIRREAKNLAIQTVVIKPHKKYYDVVKALKIKKILKVINATHLIVRDPRDMGLAALTKTVMLGKIHLSYFMEMQIGISKKDFLHTLRFKQFDCWSCPLPWLKKQVEQRTNYPKNRIKVIPSGIDLSLFSELPNNYIARQNLDLPENLILIGLIGRFDEQKGQQILLNAYLNLKNKDNVGVLLMGEKTNNEAQGYYENLIAFISDNNLQNVFIRPFRKEITTFYAAIDVLVMGSKSETVGMVTIEAMASGVPIIGSNAGGTIELLEHGKNGLLFEPMNASDLAKKINYYIKNPLNQEDKLNLKKRAEKYSFTRVCELVEKALVLKKDN